MWQGMEREQPLTRHEELNRRYRRNMRRGLAASILLHLLILLLFSLIHKRYSPGSAAGPRAGDDRAAAAGGLQAVNVRPLVEVTIRPPDPIVVPDVIVEVEEVQPQIELAGAGLDGLAGIDIGPLDGPGLPGGTGQGDGGTDTEGLFRMIAPSPRSMFLPPPGSPSSVRGREVRVLVFVDERGRVVADSTRLVPTTGNAGYDGQIRQRAALWQFDPAKRGGQSIAAWAEYTLTF
jgi:hypothetical protein